MDLTRALINITAHALQRYRERFDPAATEEIVERRIRESVRAPHWVRKSRDKFERTLVFRHNEAIFVIAEDGNNRVSVVSVFVLSWFRKRIRAGDQSKSKYGYGNRCKRKRR